MAVLQWFASKQLHSTSTLSHSDQLHSFCMHTHVANGALTYMLVIVLGHCMCAYVCRSWMASKHVWQCTLERVQPLKGTSMLLSILPARWALRSSSSAATTAGLSALLPLSSTEVFSLSCLVHVAFQGCYIPRRLHSKKFHTHNCNSTMLSYRILHDSSCIKFTPQSSLTTCVHEAHCLLFVPDTDCELLLGIQYPILMPNCQELSCKAAVAALDTYSVSHLTAEAVGKQQSPRESPLAAQSGFSLFFPDNHGSGRGPVTVYDAQLYALQGLRGQNSCKQLCRARWHLFAETRVLLLL